MTESDGSAFLSEACGCDVVVEAFCKSGTSLVFQDGSESRIAGRLILTHTHPDRGDDMLTACDEAVVDFTDLFLDVVVSIGD